MPDIRLVRPRGSKLIAVLAALLAAGLVAWVSPFVFGDPTEAKARGIGAKSGLGEVRSPVIPVRPVAFESLTPLQAKDLGRFVRLTGTAETRQVSGAVWVRSDDRRRILLRWEPWSAETKIPVFGPGHRVQVDGYVQRLSRAEFEMWTDSVNAAIPKPPPGVKFGDQPDSNFARVDSLFVKDYYVSARPSMPAATSTAAAGTGTQ